MLLTMTPDRWLQRSDDPALDRRVYELTAGNIAMLRGLAERFAVDIELDTPGAAHALLTESEARAARGRSEGKR